MSYERAATEVTTATGKKPALLVDDATFELLMDCIHCGFCLPTCPTFALTGDEADSPRGRLYYLRLLRRGALTPTRRC